MDTNNEADVPADAALAAAAAPQDAPDTLSFTFRKPVEHAGKTYAAISVDRAPMWGEMKGAYKSGSIEASTWLASTLGGIPIPALNKLDARDGALIDKFFSSFT